VNNSRDFGTDGSQAAHPPRLASDSLISIADVRRIFGLGRTAAYELTHRPDFPAPVRVSARCYRWWASEVDKFAAVLSRERGQRTPQPTAKSRLPHPAAPARSITGKVRAARASNRDAS
jgi:predicted DNA-binding transcriptional regulator AlpA